MVFLWALRRRTGCLVWRAGCSNGSCRTDPADPTDLTGRTDQPINAIEFLRFSSMRERHVLLLAGEHSPEAPECRHDVVAEGEAEEEGERGAVQLDASV